MKKKPRNINETQTRGEYIDPALIRAGWTTETVTSIQREYKIPAGYSGRGRPETADYVLFYKSREIAVVEAKRYSLPAEDGVKQATNYARSLNVRFAFSSNGREIIEIDRKAGTKKFVSEFPTPHQILQRIALETNDRIERQQNRIQQTKAGLDEANDLNKANLHNHLFHPKQSERILGALQKERRFDNRENYINTTSTGSAKKTFYETLLAHALDIAVRKKNQIHPVFFEFTLTTIEQLLGRRPRSWLMSFILKYAGELAASAFIVLIGWFCLNSITDFKSNDKNPHPANVPKVVPVVPKAIPVNSNQPTGTLIQKGEFSGKSLIVPQFSQDASSSKSSQNISSSRKDLEKIAVLKNQKIDVRFQVIDALLEKSLKSTMERLKPEDRNRLLRDQINWIKKREIAIVRNPIEADAVRVKMTISRTKELEQYR